MTSMTSNPSGSGSGLLPDFVGVIVSAYAEDTIPALATLVLYSALGTACLPLLLALFYFSTPRIRRTPLFGIVVFNTLLGIALSCWMVTIMLKALLKPLSGSPHTAFIATPLVAFFSPWVFDLVLLLRLYAVFPIATTPKRTFWAVFAFAVSVKAARLGCGIADVVLWVPNVGPQPYTSLYSPSNSSFVHSSLLKAAATFDLVDHLFVAICFLWKLRISFGSLQDAVRPKDAATGSLTHRLRMVFYIALGNFVFPVIFNFIVLLVVSVNSIDFTVTLYLQPINAYLNIFGVVFATVWSSAHSPPTSSNVLGKMREQSYPLAAYGVNSTLAGDVIDVSVENMQKMGEYTTTTV